MQVICDNAWPYARGVALVKGAKYEVLKDYWYNGEGWFVVRRIGDLTGKFTSAPDVFFADVR